ncbi:MAG: glycosyltransferase family 4 protein [Myxococcales bacterium]
MRVALAVPGRFHAFETAMELERCGHLRTVITPLPWFRIRRHSTLPRERFSSLHLHAAFRVLLTRTPAALARQSDVEFALNTLFDHLASFALPSDIDLCVGYAGAFLSTLRRARGLGAKTVVERHSAHCDEQTALLADEYERLGMPFESSSRARRREREEYAEADAILIPSKFVERTFLERGFAASKLIRAPLSADLSQFSATERTSSSFKVIFVGGFSVRKGVKYLLDAWRKLDLPDAELWFVGSEEPSLREKLNPEAIRGVSLKGHADRATLVQYMSQCDVLCLPSIEDGFGLVMAQAMACGLAVLHSANTGGADIVRPGVDGFEFPIRDSDRLAALIERLYRDRGACRDLGRNGLSRVQELGGWQQYGDSIVSAYRALTGDVST